MYRQEQGGEAMGNCIFCTEPAGFWKTSHKECKRRHEQGKSKIASLVGQVGSEDGDLSRLETSIEQIAAASRIDKETVNALVVSGWEKAVDLAFDDGILSEEEKIQTSEMIHADTGLMGVPINTYILSARPSDSGLHLTKSFHLNRFLMASAYRGMHKQQSHNRFLQVMDGSPTI